MSAHDLASGTGARRRDTFLAMVVHELRSPITVLIGNSEVIAELGESLPPPRRAELARDLLDASLRLSQMVDDLEIIGRLEGAALTERLEAVDLGAALRAALAAESGALAGALDGLPPVRGRAELVGRALAATVANARSATAAAGQAPADPELRARVTADAVRVEVVDSAGTIPEEERWVVFRRLERTPGGGSRRPHALGLTVARVVAEALGGAAGVEDSPGGDGAVVWLRFPRAAEGGADPNV